MSGRQADFPGTGTDNCEQQDMAKRRKRRIRWWTLAILLAAAIASYRLVNEVGQDRKPADRFTIIGVNDGDTVELTGGDKLRLVGVDTPEEGERFHDAAKAMTQRLCLGKVGRVEYVSNRRDKYGRLLGLLYVDDSLLVNEQLVDSGLAYVYLFDDQELKSPEINRLISAQNRALAAERNLFGLSRHAESYYLAPTRSFRFHRPSCDAVVGKNDNQVKRFGSRREALEIGLSPCRNCRP